MAVQPSAATAEWSLPFRHEQGRRQQRWVGRYIAVLAVIDAVAGSTAGLVAYAARFGESTGGASSYIALTVAMPVLWVAVALLLDCYEPRVLGLGSEEFQRVLRAFVGATALLGFVSYAFKLEVARGYVILALPLAGLLSALGRYGARKWLHRRRVRGDYLHNVIAVGAEHAVVDLVTQLRRDQYSGMRVVGACLSAGDGARLVGLGVPIFGTVDDVAEVVRLSGADTVAVTGGVGVDPARLRRLSWELEGTDTDLVVSPGLMEVAGPRLHIRPVSGLPLLHVEEPQFSGARRVLKGAFDRVAALTVLLLALPLILLIAVGVRMSGPGPVIFRQTRTGRQGREFTLYKFRSMYADAEQRRAELADRNVRAEGLLFKVRNDPRITPVGRWLRRLSLDELPQLVNIVLGHMSLVGPRPPLPDEVALYEDHVRRRLLVKPGLTGLWQVSGRSDLTWEESVRLDLRYVENWSFALDLMILWKTGSAISRGRGAY
jgi:exopolysaccharide biosynthesis polyprenyl glycosylphosphotransferase